MGIETPKFTRELAPDEERSLEMAVDQVADMLARKVSGSPRGAHQEHGEMLEQAKLRRSVEAVAREIFARTNRVPDAADIFSEAKERLEKAA